MPAEIKIIRQLCQRHVVSIMTTPLSNQLKYKKRDKLRMTKLKAVIINIKCNPI
jgi:hypothetical protein